ncbi:tetratricopeptide repeat protein [Streptomyces sp. NPDC004008]
MLRDQLTPDQRRQAGRDAEALLTAAAPGDVKRPSTWTTWRVLLPHLLAVDPAIITSEPGRDAVRDACWYLLDRGQAPTARDRLQQLHHIWSRQLGPDHEGTLWTAHYLARAHGDTQDHARARALGRGHPPAPPPPPPGRRPPRHLDHRIQLDHPAGGRGANRGGPHPG